MAEYKVVDVTNLENRLKEVCDMIRTYSYGEYDGIEIPFTKNRNGIAQTIETVALKNEMAGMQSGSASGYGQGRHYAAEQAQNFGTKTNYTYWKALEDITDLKIPYSMKPINCSYMFSSSVTSDNSTIDLSQYDIDFSKCTDFTYWLNNSPVGKIGVLDTTSASNISTLLCNARQLVTIEHLKLKEDGSQSLATYFGTNNLALQNINEIIGEFGNSFSFTNNSVLTHDTLVRILGALKNYSGTSTTRTLTIGDTNIAKLSDTEKAVATEKGWTLA